MLGTDQQRRGRDLGRGNSSPVINYNWVVGNTSGDDGGGIYCMGNLYYTDAGERFDISPDVSVAVEDNVIAGNNTVRGAPGGLRASRFGRVDLRRNLIVANERGGAHAAEGAFICVMEGNIVADNGAKRDPATPKFRLTGDITARKFDPRSYVTEIGTNAALGKDHALSGGVVRIGKQWSVVKTSGPNSLVIWGKVTDEAPKVEILDRYLATE
jgi:predicted outer membrane repeat protein